jgi:hypothetical protein
MIVHYLSAKVLMNCMRRNDAATVRLARFIDTPRGQASSFTDRTSVIGRVAITRSFS